MSKTTKVRFAPSPTGFLHIGGMRSALFNWLYAKKTDGVFMLRMEDTDRERYVPEAVEQIKASHAWLGLEPDQFEIQSERLEVYEDHAEQLLKNGALYRCWCTPERLDKLREAAKEAKQPFKYDRYCLDHPGDPDEKHVLRFKIPDAYDDTRFQTATGGDQKLIHWEDAVRGWMGFHIKDQDDFVAMKSDGYPTYNFANVVDDHTMDVTHVLRAEEFLSSTPKHLLLYAAFGWEPPVFAHLPQVLGPDGRSKLSKRHGAQSVLEYRDQGFLPEAIINFMALLGWNEGDGSTKEIYTSGELIKAFSLERIQKSPAVFDPERLLWLNGMHIRAASLDRLMELAEPFWPQEAKAAPDQHKRRVLGLLQDRLKVLAELPELTGFFFAEPKAPKLSDQEKQLVGAAAKVIEGCNFTHDDLEAGLRKLAEEKGIKAGQLFMPIRQALTGSTTSPGLFETMLVLGRDKVLTRLRTV